MGWRAILRIKSCTKAKGYSWIVRRQSHPDMPKNMLHRLIQAMNSHNILPFMSVHKVLTTYTLHPESALKRCCANVLEFIFLRVGNYIYAIG